MLLRKAEKDYKVFKSLSAEWDEEYLDLACYHLQQAIEKLLKKYIELSGENYDYTHNITELYLRCTKLGLPENEGLDLMGGTITGWEASSRYGDSFVATSAQIKKASSVYESLYVIVKGKSDEISAEQKNQESKTESVKWE